MMHMHVKDVHGVVKQEVVLMLIRFDCGKLNWAAFEPGRYSATLSRSLFECRTKINHPRHHVANKYQMSHI